MRAALLISFLYFVQALGYVHGNELCLYGVCAHNNVSEECKASIVKSINADVQSDKSTARILNFQLSEQLLSVRNAAIQDGAEVSVKVIDKLIYKALLLTMKDKKIQGYNHSVYYEGLKDIEATLESNPLNVSPEKNKQLEELFDGLNKSNF